MLVPGLGAGYILAYSLDWVPIACILAYSLILHNSYPGSHVTSKFLYLVFLLYYLELRLWSR